MPPEALQAWHLAVCFYAVAVTPVTILMCFLWHLEKNGKLEAALSVPLSFLLLYIAFIISLGFSSFVLWVG